MDNARNDLPLHKTLHYRKLRTLLKLMCDFEQINLAAYDIFHMTAYRCFGDSLNGKNVRFNVKGSGCSPFVSNNKYEVIEIPAKNNKEKISGNFLVLVKNTDFDYWMLLKMHHSINKQVSVQKNRLIENINITPIGKYTLSCDEDGVIFISKEENGQNCDFGGNSFRNEYFDQIGIRKKAYKTNSIELLNDIAGRKQNIPGTFIGEKAVEIYKKKRKKKL